MPILNLLTITLLLSLFSSSLFAEDTSLTRCHTVGCLLSTVMIADANTANLHGCAIIFNNPPFKKFKYPMKEGKIGGTSVFVNMTDSRAAAGLCSDVRASDVADKANGYACEKLEQKMKQDFDGCTSFGGRGNSLGNFTIQSLDNLVEPTQQKSDRLMKIANNMSYGNNTNTYEDYTIEAYKITQVLTIFLGGNNSLVDHTSSQMTCLKVITEQQVSNPDRLGNIAIALKGNWLFTSIFVFMGISRCYRQATNYTFTSANDNIQLLLFYIRSKMNL
ncbi:conserved hypothetical protein [Microsporum canis CBS 113480]|uniref:Uncharacterized protein n=1 Tax=Arthroderma otae (strain ATCC MYA-4605 / CBS 113480) TaxID=554155 RepID=C5FNU6_ARTOC|nr:conserved hypothetical protein [Microsporum canis CBS 113480]EEQ31799.1 conserved hypothetical protein [Microsporum canis CBS 113480]